MANLAVVSTITEHRLRDGIASLGGGKVPGRDLVRLMVNDPYRPMSRQAAHMAIGNAVRCDLLMRSGPEGDYAYRLNAEWQRPEVRPQRSGIGERARRRQRKATAYNGPAFDRAPLVPSLGVCRADPEVMPPEVADLIDSLHGRFYRHGCGVEVE